MSGNKNDCEVIEAPHPLIWRQSVNISKTSIHFATDGKFSFHLKHFFDFWNLFFNSHCVSRNVIYIHTAYKYEAIWYICSFVEYPRDLSRVEYFHEYSCILGILTLKRAWIRLGYTIAIPITRNYNDNFAQWRRLMSIDNDNEKPECKIIVIVYLYR